MKIMLHLIHYGEIYPSAVAKDYQMSLSAVQKQFERFEEAGVGFKACWQNTSLFVQ